MSSLRDFSITSKEKPFDHQRLMDALNHMTMEYRGLGIGYLGESILGKGIPMITLGHGKKEILSIDIKPEIVDPDDIETLSDILVAAVNEAIKRVEETNSAEMAKITGNLNMPGMF